MTWYSHCAPRTAFLSRPSCSCSHLRGSPSRVTCHMVGPTCSPLLPPPGPVEHHVPLGEVAILPLALLVRCLGRVLEGGCQSDLGGENKRCEKERKEGMRGVMKRKDSLRNVTAMKVFSINSSGVGSMGPWSVAHTLGRTQAWSARYRKEVGGNSLSDLCLR